MCKVQIGTIRGLFCTNLRSALCTTILGLAVQSTDCIWSNKGRCHGDLRLQVSNWFVGFRGGVGPLCIGNSIPTPSLNPKNQILTQSHKIWGPESQIIMTAQTMDEHPIGLFVLRNPWIASKAPHKAWITSKVEFTWLKILLHNRLLLIILHFCS